MEIMYSNDYLAHYGILGQKWGVRRFQNPDGSLTEAGKRRYDTSVGSSKKYAKTLNTMKQDQARLISNRVRSTVKIERAKAKGNQGAYEKEVAKRKQTDADLRSLTDQINRRVNEAKSKGYTVEEKNTLRFAQEGKMFARYALTNITGALVLTGVDVARYGRVGAGFVDSSKFKVYIPIKEVDDE